MCEPTSTDIAQLVLVRQTSCVSNFKEFFYTERVPLQLWGAAIQCFQLHIQSTLNRYFSPLRGSGSPSWIRSHHPGLGEVGHLLSMKLWEKE